MVGLISCGVYVPLWRLDLGVLGPELKGERSIGNFDEDALTMAVAAGMNCLKGVDRNSIDGLFFATCTSPYKEKQVSVLISFALDLRTDILTADFSNSTRAGTTALIAAYNAVKSGSAKRILVIASDMRNGQPGSELERLLGDGSVALLVSSDDAKIEIVDYYSVADEILDTWASNQDMFIRSWEERFVSEVGYLDILPKAGSKLLKRNNIGPDEINKAVYNGPGRRRHQQAGRILAVKDGIVQEPLFGMLGDTGVAFSLMLLCGALAKSEPKDRILLMSYGFGADSLLLQTREEIKPAPSLKEYLESKRTLKNYTTYLQWRGFLEMVRGRRRPSLPPPSASALWRERDQNLRLHGVKCLQCGTVQYPLQRVCFSCRSEDRFERYRFSDKRGKLVTFGIDNATPTPEAPQVVAVVDCDGGGRLFLYMTDIEVDQLKVGMHVEFTLRKLNYLEGIHNYYWKCMPIRFE